MSHTTPLDTSTGINQPLVLRKARAAEIEFRFWDDAAFTVPHLITDDFELNFKSHVAAAVNLLQLKTSDDTLEIDAHIIRAALTTVNTNWSLGTFYYELFNTTTGKNWMQSSKNKMIIGDAIEDVVTEVNGVINIGDNVVNVQVVIAGFDVASLTAAQKAALWAALAPYSLGES